MNQNPVALRASDAVNVCWAGMDAVRTSRVLVVDDDEAIREAIAELLRDQGYDVSVAANGEQALEVCRSRANPDLILLDLRMPVMDGIEFTRRKDQDPTLAHVPVCVITAFRDFTSIPPSAAVVLHKPLGSTDLLVVARRFCAEK